MTRSVPDRRTGPAALILSALPLVCAFASAFGQATSKDEASAQLLQKAYAKHDDRVRAALPAHSAMPPLIQLSKTVATGDDMDREWESCCTRFFVSATFADPGLHGPSDATSISTVFHDGVRVYEIPAKSCDAVVKARAVAIQAKLDQAHSFAYAMSTLRIMSVWKGSRRYLHGSTARAVNFGGSLQFPSGHVETLIAAGHGFLDLNKEYVIFMWKPHASRHTYIVAEAYLVSEDRVFRSTPFRTPLAMKECL